MWVWQGEWPVGTAAPRRVSRRLSVRGHLEKEEGLGVDIMGELPQEALLTRWGCLWHLRPRLVLELLTLGVGTGAHAVNVLLLPALELGLAQRSVLIALLLRLLAQAKGQLATEEEKEGVGVHTSEGLVGGVKWRRVRCEVGSQD